MKHRTSILIAVLVVSTLAFAGAANAQGSNPLAVPVTGTFTASANSGPLSALGSGSFSGTLNLQQFISQAGNIVAVGNLVGTITNTAGQTASVVISTIDSAVSNLTGGCQGVSLTLTPGTVTTMGASITVNPINLSIAPQTGLVGGILNNLLCTLGGALNNGAPVNQVVGILNQLISTLHL